MVVSLGFASRAIAAPAAELTMHISDWEQVDEAVELNLVIDIGSPSEPYASLDFNLVSSSEEHLSVVDLSEAGDKSKLAFDFSPDYGGAYHAGRIDEASGSVRYLVGIFSQSSGNNIAAETNICVVRLRYTGDLEQELSLENLKLIYKNTDGEITSTALEARVSQSISPADFAQITNEPTPLLGLEDGASFSGIVYILMIPVALIVAWILLKSGKLGSKNPRGKNK